MSSSAGSAQQKGNKFLDTALEFLSYAIDAERDHDYTDAYVKYMAALDYLMAAQQHETNEKSKIFLKTKADEYLNKAEEVKKRVDVDTHKQYLADSDEKSMPVGRSRTTQSVILDEAFKCAKQAISADTSHDYAEAYGQYMKSMDYFMFAQRYEFNEQSRSLILSEVAEYLSRAEIIKQHLDSLRQSNTTNTSKINEKEPPRPPEVVFLQTAIHITERARQQDEKQNYRSAYELYNGALDYFMLAQKYERTEETRVAIRATIEEYLARAEVLKKFMS